MDVPYDVLDIAPPTLRKGDSGEAVKELQEALIAAGYDVGKKGADGIFGSETLSAVRAFQGDRGLTPDGIAGPLTHAALRATEDDEPEDDEDEDKAPMEEVPAVEPMTVEQRVRQLELAVFGMSFDVGGGADG